MKLLICTQAVDQDDPVLGFFVRWVEEFARHCERVVIVCLREGAHTLPENVTVCSAGKERGVPRLLRWWRVLHYIIALRKQYDAVFVHMNPEYMLLAGSLWRRWGKRTVLWYTHKSVTLRLRLAVRLADAVCTASRESFRLQSPKVAVVGHGIDTETFKPGMKETSIETRVVTIGRITRAKRLVEMLRVLDVLHARGEKFTFTIVGAPATTADTRYETILRREAHKRPFSDKIVFAGPVAHSTLPEIFGHQDVFLNLSTTGSTDKAILESLAMTVPVVTTNEALGEILAPYGLYVRALLAERIADAIDRAVNSPERAATVATLRGVVVAKHSLTNLIPRLLTYLES